MFPKCTRKESRITDVARPMRTSRYGPERPKRRSTASSASLGQGFGSLGGSV